MPEIITLTDDDILAFPSRGDLAAKGWGKNATGGRGLPVYFVDNLNDSGPGSLRQAETDLENSGQGGNIIFRTNGIINLTQELIFSINVDNVTIYGQSAQGQGITIYGAGTTIRGGNFIVRHTKHRVGDANFDISLRVGSTNWNGDKSNYMFDHVSCTWGQNSANFGITSNATDELNKHSYLTLQNSIIGESLNIRNVLLYGQGISKISIINNALTNTEYRNIWSTVGENNEWEMINNYVYGHVGGVLMTAKNKINVIGNVFNEGHSTQLADTIYLTECNTGNCPPDGDDDFTGSILYATDNPSSRGLNQMNGTAATYLTGTRYDPSDYTPRASSTVRQYLLDYAGARRTMEGLDSVDQLQMDGIDNESGGSFSYSEADTIGLPTQPSPTTYTDSNNNGLSDAYEAANGGSINQSDRPATAVLSDGRIVDQSGVTNYATEGYTHLEIFMADLAGDWDTFDVSTPPVEPEPSSNKINNIFGFIN